MVEDRREVGHGVLLLRLKWKVGVCCGVDYYISPLWDDLEELLCTVCPYFEDTMFTLEDTLGCSRGPCPDWGYLNPSDHCWPLPAWTEQREYGTS